MKKHGVLFKTSGGQQRRGLEVFEALLWPAHAAVVGAQDDAVAQQRAQPWGRIAVERKAMVQGWQCQGCYGQLGACGFPPR